MGHRLPLGLVVIAVLVAACAGADTGAGSSSTSAAATSTTTTAPPEPTTTTTSEPDPCSSEFCVLYTIAEDAMWSDGSPVVTDDLVFTHEQGVNEPAPVAEVTALDERSVVVRFSETYGAWQSLFSVVLPAHVGVDAALEVTAGPFVLDNWVPDESITLVRNPAHPSQGDVQQITFVFQESVRDAIRALERDEVDVVSLKPLDWIVADVADMEGVVFETEPGAFWEHIDFNLDDPLLSQLWVREMLVTAIPRTGLLDSTVRRIAPEIDVLDNTLWVTQSWAYSPHIDIQPNLEAAEQMMVERFCERGSDGIYSCQGRRMSFVFAYAFGDPYRETVFEIVRDTFASIGIELVEREVTPSTLFSSEFFFGGPDVWQMMSFSWKASEEPLLSEEIYRCTGAALSGFGLFNVTRFCDDEVDALLDEAAATADPTNRAELYNQVDAIYLGAVASLPLYQKPEFMAWQDGISGPQLNMSSATDLWNIGDWTGQETIVISLEEEPLSLDPVSPQLLSAEMVKAALLSGAFQSGPDLAYRPDLVESAEVYSGG